MEDFKLKRYEGNPIFTKDNFPIPVNAVFNCGQTEFEGKTLLLVPCIYNERRKCDLPNGTITGIHVALSEDGIHFDVNPEPLFTGTPWSDNTPDRCDTWVIDPRVTKIGDTYYIVRPGQCSDGPAALLYKTKDFKTAEFIDCIAPISNRVPCLFPEKIGGKYYKIDRPYNHVSHIYKEKTPYDAERDSVNRAGMWISSSSDLTFWGHYRPLLRPELEYGNFKNGPTPPIKTDDGWLVIIHGVTMEGTVFHYSLGAMLLDLNNPEKVIGVTKSPILEPETDYEKYGRADNVVFACGAIANKEKDELRVYYGAADTCIGLAYGKLSAIIDACKKGL